MSKMRVINDSLGRMSSTDWVKLREASTGCCLWHKREWWHNKYYRDNPPNDGDALQQPRKGNPEVPHLRELFYPSPASRFSLGSKQPVAYFSNDFGINCCETIEQFSANPNLPFKELSEYLSGKGNPTPGWCGHPINYHLVSDTYILDVSANANQFLLALCRAGEVASDEVWKCFQSRDEEEKKITQLVSIEAKRMGFDGILFASVRAPVDVSMPSKNLVMFKPDKIRPGMPPNNRLQCMRGKNAARY